MLIFRLPTSVLLFVKLAVCTSAVAPAATSIFRLFSPTSAMPSGFFEVSSLTVYVPGSRLSTVTSLLCPPVIVISLVALTLPSASFTSKVYLPSAFVVVVGFPLYWTLLLIFREPKSVFVFLKTIVSSSCVSSPECSVVFSVLTLMTFPSSSYTLYVTVVTKPSASISSTLYFVPFANPQNIFCSPALSWNSATPFTNW